MANSLEQVWAKQGVGSILLAPLGGLYAIGWWSYQSIYTLKLKKPFEPHNPVVTIGNLIAGGTGKTPTSLYLASVIKKLGREVVMSMSGYGFPHSVDATLAPDGQLNAHEWGDEPAMVRHMVPDLPLIVGRDRVMAAEIAHKNFPNSVLLMDDGFQHLRLKQHVTIVLDEEMPNRFCLPSGPYREPRSTGKKRANLSVPNRRFILSKGATTIQHAAGNVIESKDVNILCALARPQRLLHGLKGIGLNPQIVHTLPDHDPLTAGTLLDGFDASLPLLVTAKDWVKLRERSDLGDRTIWMASYESKIEPEDQFESWLKEKLDEYPAKTTS